MNKKVINITPVNEFTDIVGVPPTPSVTKIPKWYKNLPQTVNKEQLKIRNGMANFTVKACVPFLDAMTNGYMITLPTDISVDWEGNVPKFNWATKEELIDFHNPDQSNGFPAPEGYYKQIVKFGNYYTINTPKDYSVLFTHPLNRFDLPFITISGIVDCDTYKMPVKFPFFIKENWTGIIEAGTPIAQITLIKRESWSTKINEYNRRDTISNEVNFFRKLTRSYKTKHWVKKEYM